MRRNHKLKLSFLMKKKISSTFAWNGYSTKRSSAIFLRRPGFDKPIRISLNSYDIHYKISYSNCRNFKATVENFTPSDCSVSTYKAWRNTCGNVLGLPEKDGCWKRSLPLGDAEWRNSRIIFVISTIAFLNFRK